MAAQHDIPRREDLAKWVPNNCSCGAKGGAYLKHYDIMRCDCGRYHWALQPHADGPFVLYPWLGIDTRFNIRPEPDRR